MNLGKTNFGVRNVETGRKCTFGAVCHITFRISKRQCLCTIIRKVAESFGLSQYYGDI